MNYSMLFEECGPFVFYRIVNDHTTLEFGRTTSDGFKKMVTDARYRYVDIDAFIPSIIPNSIKNFFYEHI